jgi:hypothetical protein
MAQKITAMKQKPNILVISSLDKPVDDTKSTSSPASAEAMRRPSEVS